MGMVSFAVALMVTLVIMSHCIYGREFYDDQEIKVQQLLKQLNKPALKSIKSEDGDIIDCVPLTSQPAFDNPLLKNHTIQMRPSFIPESDSTYTNKKAEAITQVWHKNGEYCPENTIPIRRTKKEDILRAESIERFGKKTPPGILEVTASGHHEYAIAGATGGKFFGTKASINIWKPSVAHNDEFSLAQTWLVSGDGGSLNTIEAGWQVYPQIYGHNNPTLFIYWTRDGYQTTGCYNLACSGFVQTNKQYSVGAAYTTFSQYNGIQYALNLLIWKDKPTGNWWLRINEDVYMGYWPGSLFTSLGSGATRNEWGGEVYVRDGVHSTTDMGSGHFAVEGYGKASYIRNLKTVDATNTLRDPAGLYSFATNSNCYSYQKGSNGTTFGSHFYYGGPGKNGNCP
ncbi:unnamed protein product [Arabis nemorensis]|uniref:Neprosin PEP catalytic domain-containing protein n=1 Tax=Arabis nemorensis TaxID=586526 RepID=A0A565BEP6_9BRAS|nr:unnamed protein product [Arabis nemorensis]